MAEIDDKESQAQEGAPEEVTLSKTQGLGAFLRRERERRGLSHEQIAEMTRLRRHMVAALEEEAWDELPPPVFVKGFIKSYAKALGLDQKEVLDLYGEVPLPESETPKLLLEPRRASKRPLVFVLAVAVVLGVVSFFIWKEYGSVEKTVPVREAETEAVPIQPEPPPIPEQPLEQEVVEEVQPIPEESRPAPPSPVVEEVPGLEEEPRGTGEEGRVELPAERSEEQAQPAEEEIAIDTVSGPAETTGWHVLKAVVEDRTWIRVTVDDGAPKE
jgi:cytoskeleton protein RodZ